MSSGNLVSVIYAPETVYGVEDAPLSTVTANTVRFTSESLSGTPTTSESAAIRVDRMSGGQITTGLDVGGGLDWELSAGKFFDDWFEASMMSTWVAAEILSTDVTLSPTTPTQANLIITGDFTTIGVAVNDVLQLVPASGPCIVLSVISITSTTEVVVATPTDTPAISSVAMNVEIPENLSIGTEQKSFTIGKSYLDTPHDLTTDLHSQTYTGSLVSAFNVSCNYGEISTGSFTTLGNGYVQEYPSYEQRIIAAGGSVSPAGTEQPVNASIDVPLVTSAGTSADYCIESFTIDLDNGLNAQSCIGEIAPSGYILGTAAIAITASIYNSDNAYDIYMPNKLTQAPISMTFTMDNSDGGWAFFLPAVQLSFPDPASSGQNTTVMLDATGTAKVGADGGSALIIYKLLGDQ